MLTPQAKVNLSMIFGGVLSKLSFNESLRTDPYESPDSLEIAAKVLRLPFRSGSRAAILHKQGGRRSNVSVRVIGIAAPDTALRTT